jgi:phosphate acyltransferase
MGGDYAPNNEVAGAIQAARLLGDSAVITLVGDEQVIRKQLQSLNAPETLCILHASDVVRMDDEPSSIVKQRQASSLYIGVDAMRNGNVDAFVSAGNTGAVMATSTMLCGRIKGVSRPTIGSFMPTKTGQPVLVLDVGANVDSKPRFLYDYAVMGEIYYRHMIGVERPRVGLLNVGEEESKGTEVVREAFTLMREAPFNFIGNVEGRDIFAGTCDVVICDGFEGNIVLKFAESILGLLREKLKAYASRSILNTLAVGLVRPILRSALKDMDYQEYGGVPLLGINGVTIIGHGSSTPKAISNMIRRAVDVVRSDVNGHIAQALSPQIRGHQP